MNKLTGTPGAPAEDVELIRADDLAVVEVVRTAGVAPVVRFISEGEVFTWTANEAFIAGKILFDLASVEAEVGDEESLLLAGEMAEIFVAIFTAATLVRDEIEAAA